MTSLPPVNNPFTPNLFSKTTWVNGEVVTADDMNRIENNLKFQVSKTVGQAENNESLSFNTAAINVYAQRGASLDFYSNSGMILVTGRYVVYHATTVSRIEVMILADGVTQHAPYPYDIRLWTASTNRYFTIPIAFIMQRTPAETHNFEFYSRYVSGSNSLLHIYSSLEAVDL
jgi:hypothetical protein